uniref:Uncharacterized protein n=1 Tax=Romanomermis culicivorax TaxID=13658 RepID=A0A915K4L1_ROMCU
MPTDCSSASSQSSELQLALPALPPSTTVSTTALDKGAINQSTSAANMVIPSKEIASTALIVSLGIVCWKATSRAFQDPCHIPSIILPCPQRLSFINTPLRELSKFQLNSEPLKRMHLSILVPNAPYCHQD